MPRHVFAAATVLLMSSMLSAAQAPQPTAAPTAKPEEGIPVTDATVQKSCGSCHKPDDKGQMSRISFIRTTPEGWQTIIQRSMVTEGLQWTVPQVIDTITPGNPAYNEASRLAKTIQVDGRTWGDGAATNLAHTLDFDAPDLEPTRIAAIAVEETVLALAEGESLDSFVDVSSGDAPALSRNPIDFPSSECRPNQ